MDRFFPDLYTASTQLGGSDFLVLFQAVTQNSGKERLNDIVSVQKLSKEELPKR